MPSIGAKTLHKQRPSSDVASYSWQHTRAAGTGLVVLVLWRTTSSLSTTVTGITFGGTAMTVQAQDIRTGGDSLGAAVATLDPGVGPEGTETITVTLNRDSGRQFIGWAVDIADTDGAQGGAATSARDSGAASVSTSYTPTVENELLVSLGGGLGINSNPSAGAGWNNEGTAEIGGGSTAIDSILQSSTATDTSTQTASVSFEISVANRAICVVGWAPSANVSGAGELPLPAMGIGGHVSVTVAGTGDPVVPAAMLDGLGDIVVAASGILPIARADLTGLADITVAGNGNLVVPAAMLDGLGDVRAAGGGALLVAPVGLTGVGKITALALWPAQLPPPILPYEDAWHVVVSGAGSPFAPLRLRRGWDGRAARWQWIVSRAQLPLLLATLATMRMLWLATPVEWGLDGAVARTRGEVTVTPVGGVWMVEVGVDMRV